MYLYEMYFVSCIMYIHKYSAYICIYYCIMTLVNGSCALDIILLFHTYFDKLTYIDAEIKDHTNLGLCGLGGGRGCQVGNQARALRVVVAQQGVEP